MKRDCKGLGSRGLGRKAETDAARVPAPLISAPGSVLVCLPWQIGLPANPAKHPAGKNPQGHGRRSILHPAPERRTTHPIALQLAASIFSAIKSDILPSP